MEVKDNRKRAEAQIKKIATSKSELVNSYSNDSAKVARNKKARTGVQPPCKKKGKKTPNQNGSQSYCVL